MFASAWNAILPVYVSPSPDKAALDIDALATSWDDRGLGYAFPPTVLLPRVLDLIRSSSGTRVIWVSPNLDTCPWYPDLQTMKRDCPLSFPISNRLLSQRVPGRLRRVYHLLPETLSLASWLL